MRENFSETGALLPHFGKNEVGGAVDNAGDPFDPVGSQSFAQSLDDRHSTSNCRLECNHHAFFLCGQEYFVAVDRQQCLVCGHHVLAVFDSGQDQIFRNPGAADQFHNDIDIGSAHQCEGVVGRLGAVANQFSRPFEILVGNGLDQDAAACTTANLLLIASQDRKSAAAHGANAEQADVNGFHRNSFLNENAVMKKSSLK